MASASVARCRPASTVLSGGSMGLVPGVSLPGSNGDGTRVAVIAFAGHPRVPARLERGARLAVLPRLHAWPGLPQVHLLVQPVAGARSDARPGGQEGVGTCRYPG